MNKNLQWKGTLVLAAVQWLPAARAEAAADSAAVIDRHGGGQQRCTAAKIKRTMFSCIKEKTCRWPIGSEVKSLRLPCSSTIR